MAIDLSQFHQVFFEESIEGLDIMESALMELDPSSLDSEIINSIFRAAHSIKGGSATFGFVSVSDFTHDLETILDQVRDGRREISGDDINIFLKSVDCMRDMLSLLQDGEDGHTPSSAELKNHFAVMLSGKAPESEPHSAVESEPETQAKCGRLIHFKPGRDILQTGNDVVRMFRELSELGEVLQVECEPLLPALAELHPEECHLAWTIEINSDKSDAELLSVFEWVEDDSDIAIRELADKKCWKVYFKPGVDTMRTGNEPLRLISAMADFGELTVSCESNDIPAFSALDCEGCYLAWHLELLSSTATRESILEVFEWVADEAEITIEIAGEENSTAQEQVANDEKAAVENEVAPPQGAAAEATPKPSQEPAATPAKAKSKAQSGESGSIRVGIDKVDNLINMVGELVITQSMLGQLGTEFEESQLPKLIEGLGQLEQNTRELQESVMRIRMLPISFAFSRFPRMVRDLGQKLNKSLELIMLGEQTELDKTVMEKIGDPLVHLVRNAVDHGIELPADRLAKGKPETGTVTLNAYHQSGNVVIEIKDDGKGLDKDLLVQKAKDKGILSANEAEMLSDEQAFDLIFHPGFSTAKEISDVSGRGVGMDVVKKNIQALNGAVELTSEKDKGSTITIRLPLTLAILDGQLVRVGENIYIFPLVSIVESMQYDESHISEIAGGCRVFRLRDDYVPVIQLRDAFSVDDKPDDLEAALMVVVESDGEKVGVVVNELLAQQQVVIKSLEHNYKRVDGVSGATILGDGTVALILDIPGIVKLAGVNFCETQAFMASRTRAKFTEHQAAG